MSPPEKSLRDASTDETDAMWTETSGELPEAMARRIDIRPGLSLVLADFVPGEDVRIEFETDRTPLEFSYHLSGQASYIICHDQGEYRIEAGAGVNIVASFPRSCGVMEYLANRRIRVVAIHAAPLFLRQYLPAAALGPLDFRAVMEGDDERHCCHRAGMTPTMSIVVSQILNCPYHGLARRLFFESKTLELISLQLARFSDDASVPGAGSAADDRDAGHDAERIRRARELLLRDMENPPTLFQLADAVDMTHTRLNKGFRQLYGATAFEYLRRERLEKSRWMIGQGGMTLAEIAYATGFSGPSHFAKAFLDHFGVQPSAYLKEVRHRRTISLSSRRPAPAASGTGGTHARETLEGSAIR